MADDPDALLADSEAEGWAQRPAAAELPPLDPCPDCHVTVGTRHEGDCATALCTTTGDLRIMCAGVHDHGRQVWRGAPRPWVVTKLPDISAYQEQADPDTCQVVQLADGPVRIHGAGELTADDIAAMEAIVEASRRLFATEPPGPDAFTCPRCAATPGQLCRRENGPGGRAPHDERRALATQPTTNDTEEADRAGH